MRTKLSNQQFTMIDLHELIQCFKSK